MLEPRHKTLLAALVEAARTIPESADTQFLANSQIGKPTLDVYHDGLPGQRMDAYASDLLALEGEGLIVVTDRTERYPTEFSIQPAGYRYYDAYVGRRRWGRWAAIDDKPIGKSSMSVVWRVRNTEGDDGAIRALKEMRYDKSPTSAAFRRFEREIRILTDRFAGHPGIVQVLDFAFPGEDYAGRPYYVMPLAQSTLDRETKALKGRLDHVLDIFVPVANALIDAHGADVVHRDVKPANVLLFDFENERRPVLADFGIAFLAEEDRVTRAEAGTVGTDDFVAPELRGGGASDKVGPTVDVYSLGKTIFAVASGGDVIPREELDHPRLDLVTRYNDSRFAHLRGLLGQMVATRPEDRYPTMEAARDALVRAAENVRAGVPYSPGMYGGEHSAAERHARLIRLLQQPAAPSRADAAHAEMDAAIAAAITRAERFKSDRPSLSFQRGRDNPDVLAVAASCAEDLLAAGLALVRGSEFALFEEWLGRALSSVKNRDGYRYLTERIVLAAAGVLAAHGAGALAWQLRRFDMLAAFIDEYVEGGSRWIHQEILGQDPTHLLRWVLEVLAASSTVRRAAPEVASGPRRPVLLISGLAVLRFLGAAEPDRLARFVATPHGDDFPVPFAPGLYEVSWTDELVEVGNTQPGRERDLAREVFRMDRAAFRAYCARMTPALRAAASQAAQRRGDWLAHSETALYDDRWSDWTKTSPS